MTQRALWMPICALAVSSVLVGCSGPEDELQSWMTQQRQQVTPDVQPLAEPMSFKPEPYSGLEGIEPFSVRKLTGALKQEAAQPNSLVSAELNRRKEPLEAFPLDGMSMVGSVSRKGVPHALLRVDGLLYQVKAGDYIGQNYGKIMKITETQIELREIVQDASGEWIERTASLQLQETGQ